MPSGRGKNKEKINKMMLKFLAKNGSASPQELYEHVNANDHWGTTMSQVTNILRKQDYQEIHGSNKRNRVFKLRQS